VDKRASIFSFECKAVVSHSFSNSTVEIHRYSNSNSNSHLYSTGFHNMFKSAFLSPSYRWSNRTHLNKNVLSDFLKVATEGPFLIFTGILFHSFGPHTTKIRSSNLFVHLGMCRSS